MHQSSLENMKTFCDRYLSGRKGDPLLILDLGSCDINGSYKPYFNEPAWIYRGLDLQQGPNVDIVLGNPYRWKEIRTSSVDVFISGQTFEHIEYFWITMIEISRILKTGGLCCIIAPSGGYKHRYPVDCWRFYTDGFAALARFAYLEALEIYTQDDQEKEYADESHQWKDTVMICRKPRWTWHTRKRAVLAHWLWHHLAEYSGS